MRALAGLPSRTSSRADPQLLERDGEALHRLGNRHERIEAGQRRRRGYSAENRSQCSSSADLPQPRNSPISSPASTPLA